mgnify:CR=1 FL=1
MNRHLDEHADLLPLGADDTDYRLVTSDGVRTVEAAGRTFLEVDPEALRREAEAGARSLAADLRAVADVLAEDPA